jgi:hypothetical protein
MTALNFAIDDDGVYVAVDTLVTEKGRLSRFSAKALSVPHLQGIICATGSANFFHQWATIVIGDMIVNDIFSLDSFAAEFLPKVWEDASDDERDCETSSIYHFGYDRRGDRFGGFAYHSWNGFKSEPIRHGVKLIPPISAELPMIDLPDDLAEACLIQRAEEDAVRYAKCATIGGQVIAYTMQRDARQPTSAYTTVRVAHEFDDRDDMFSEAMLFEQYSRLRHYM